MLDSYRFALVSHSLSSKEKTSREFMSVLQPEHYKLVCGLITIRFGIFEVFSKKLIAKLVTDRLRESTFHWKVTRATTQNIQGQMSKAATRHHVVPARGSTYPRKFHDVQYKLPRLEI